MHLLLVNVLFTAKKVIFTGTEVTIDTLDGWNAIIVQVLKRTELDSVKRCVWIWIILVTIKIKVKGVQQFLRVCVDGSWTGDVALQGGPLAVPVLRHLPLLRARYRHHGDGAAREERAPALGPHWPPQQTPPPEDKVFVIL